jgi:hypothetical protein
MVTRRQDEDKERHKEGRGKDEMSYSKAETMMPGILLCVA